MRETEPEPQPPVPQRTHLPAYKRVRSDEEDHLTDVVTDITRLAMAISSLSLAREPGEVDDPEEYWGPSGGGQHPGADGAPEPTGAVTPGIGGYSNVPVAQTDTHRQAASHYRA
jgi:hypothetical protein